MRFVAARPALAEAVRIASAAAGGNLPILSGARIDVAGDQATVTCSNLDLTVTAKVATVEGDDGTVIVPASLLANFLRSTDSGTATLTLGDDGTLMAEAGETTITLHTLSVDEWPRLTVAKGNAVELDPAQLAELAKVVGYAAGKDGHKAFGFITTGVHFHGTLAEATDGYRLARIDLGVDVPDVTLPAPHLDRILKGAGSKTCRFTADDRWATFATDTVEWTTRLIEGDYPKLDQMIRASSPHAVELPTERLREAVRRVSILTGGDDSEGMILTVDGGKTIIRNRETERGEITDVLPSQGEFPGPLVMNGRYLADLLDNLDEPNVTFEIDTAMKPVVVRSDRLLQLVVPIRPPVKK